VTLRIAVAGKGGVGKTTCSALLLRALAISGVRPLLAVDADPNANLHQLLALPLPEGLGALREEQRAAADRAAPLADRIAFGIERRLSEGEAVDLVAMGRGEGPGCYCYVNNLLREALDRIERGYRAVVMDNEAGMEHLSRRSARRIDHLVLVGDPSRRGLEAVAALRDLSAELALPVGKTWLLLNRPYGVPGRAAPDDLGLPLLAALPHDPLLPSWENGRRSFLDLPPGESPAADAVADAARTSLLGLAV
jgi:CO dehydrogenase maturation factor